MNEYSSEACNERHIAVKERQERTEADVKEIWSAVGEVKNTVSALSNKLALTVGSITMLINVVFLFIQFFLSNHKVAP